MVLLVGVVLPWYEQLLHLHELEVALLVVLLVVEVVEVAEHIVELGLILRLHFFVDKLLKICKAKCD